MPLEATPHTDHPFLRSPNRTLVSLSFPVLLSLVAEPMTGLVDTGFIAQLGAVPLAALGVGTMALSSLFWIFNFLGVGSQTEVAQALGRGDTGRAAQVSGLALALSGVFGVVVSVGAWWASEPIAALLGATGEMQAQAVAYMQIRWLGAPAVLATLTAFGVLRGLQDMRTPLWIAVSINALNMLLDAVLIFGLGTIPPMAIEGAALASVISQWLGAGWCIWAIYKRLGFPARLYARDARNLLQVGGDLFVRTGLLTLFLLLSTRTATRIGVEAGAAHQAIRQVWIFTALFLDAFAITGQSLVGYFIGSAQGEQAKRVAWYVCVWSFGTGVVLGLAMLLGEGTVVRILVPAEAVMVFGPAWMAAALMQPVNALSFGTDGIHWGTGDFRYLRNAVMVATACGILGLLLIDEQQTDALTWVWIVTGAWISVRAIFGVLRIWPGIGQAPINSLRSVPLAT